MLTPEMRDQLTVDAGPGKVTLTYYDGCVAGFPMSEWAAIEAQMSKVRNPSRKLRNFIRVFISGAEEVTLDKQGRITIPAHLRKRAKLDKDTVLAGVGNRIEIWDNHEYDLLLEDDYDDVSDDLSDSGVELSI